MLCGQCARQTYWDDEVGSAICTTCGTLVDPSQSVLTSHLDQHDNSARQYNIFPSSTTPLKSVHGHQGWNLAGQGKEARDVKNNFAIHALIRSISASLSAPGLAARATTVFSQAMTAGSYRWGRKAKLVAAASIAVALRESHKSDSLRDIAFLINEPPLAVSRAFASILNILNLSLISTDPAAHFPALHSHLTDLVHPSQPPSPLPKALLALLSPLSLPIVMQTANALSALLSRFGDTLPIIHLPTPPTACAILILSLEAEIRGSLPNLSDLAHNLGTRIGTGKGAIMSRYKHLYDLVEDCTKQVPWLDRFAPKKGRSKLAKRVVVARGLKDVLQFQDDIWRKKLGSIARSIAVTLEVDDGSQDDGSDLDTSQPPSTEPPPERLRKKRKTHRELADASHFLLNPLSAPHTPSSTTTTPGRSPLALATYLLTADPPALSLNAMPTRLQRLVADRGGAEEISDDELFEEGEWEAMLRTEGERDTLRDVLGWEETGDAEPPAGRKRATKREDVREHGNKPGRASGRIDMEVLSKLLQDGDFNEDDGLKQLEFGYIISDGDNIRDAQRLDDEPNTHSSPPTNKGEIVETWRPLSPDRSSRSDVADRYDEEY